MPPIAGPRMIRPPMDDVMVPPIPVENQPRANGPAKAKGAIDSGVLVNHVRLINREIYLIGISRFDLDCAIGIDNAFLRCAGQIAENLSLAAQPLDGIHDVLLLVHESLAHFGSPTEVVVHPFEQLWIAGDGLNARVPRLRINLVRITTLADVALRHNNLRRQGGGWKKFGKQWI